VNVGALKYVKRNANFGAWRHLRFVPRLDFLSRLHDTEVEITDRHLYDRIANSFPNLRFVVLDFNKRIKRRKHARSAHSFRQLN